MLLSGYLMIGLIVGFLSLRKISEMISFRVSKRAVTISCWVARFLCYMRVSIPLDERETLLLLTTLREAMFGVYWISGRNEFLELGRSGWLFVTSRKKTYFGYITRLNNKISKGRSQEGPK